MNESEYRGQVGEQRVACVFVGENPLVGGYLPIDSEGGVGEQDASFRLGVIEVVALIHEEGRLTQHTESVCKTARYEELPTVVGRETDGIVLPEGGAVVAQVHRHIEDGALNALHQLGLRVGRPLEMESAYHPVAGARDIVLHETDRDAGLTVTRFVVGLHEEAPTVAESLRFEDKQAFDRCFQNVHNDCKGTANLPYLQIMRTFAEYNGADVRT